MYVWDLMRMYPALLLCGKGSSDAPCLLIYCLQLAFQLLFCFICSQHPAECIIGISEPQSSGPAAIKAGAVQPAP